jgi:oxygen-dependent protoporphyrinogen oxidase
MTDIDVAIVGGGISGMAAARALCARGHRVRLFERDADCGGVIRTERVGDFIIDTGPDTLLTHKPAALALVRDAGLESGLISPFPNRTTYVLRHSRLRALPETSALGLPTSLRTLVKADAFSWPGKLRMAAEPLIPAGAPDADESISSFVRRRFGHEAVAYVAEPLLAGLHRGDATKLSMRALFPVLASAERTHGSVARAWRAVARHGGGSLSLRGGLGDLPARLREQLPGEVPVTGNAVECIEHRRQFVLHLQHGAPVSARAVLLATPAHVAATLASGLDPELARLCSGIRFQPSINVALGYRSRDIRHDLAGWGFVVPPRDRRRIRSASWVTSKWPGRAPEGHELIRASISDSPADILTRQDDESLVASVHAELRDLLGITGDPVLGRVYRRPLAMPQLEVGHLERMAAIDRRLEHVPGLYLSASGFRGVGLPDCIGDAQRVAGTISDYLG